MRRARKLIFPLAALTSLALLLLNNSFSDINRLKITRVIDGDTIELSGGRRCRYIGIDTPETEKNTPSGWIMVNEPFAQEAKRVNEALVLGKPVRFEHDVQKEDKYKRLLVYAFVKEGADEKLVQAELLRKGLAYLYTFPPNVKYVDTLVEALKEAKAKGAGIWSVSMEIDPEDAGKFIGERKIVEGVIKRSRSTAKVIALTMDGLKVVIFKNDLGLFEREGIDPALFYKGKKVRVFGLIKMYRGFPEIIVSNPWQIDVLQ